MKIEFRTERYQASHGRKPKGWGVWAFEFDDGEQEDRVVFTPHAMTLTQAKAWFRKNYKSAAPCVDVAP